MSLSKFPVKYPIYFILPLTFSAGTTFSHGINWASEASPTQGCSIEISHDIYMLSVCFVCQINCVGRITWTKHAHAQSIFFWRLNQ